MSTMNPVLSPLETRVLGVLVEKEHTVPDIYPLSLNELRVKLTDDRPRVRCRTEDMEAYDLYLKGRHQFYRVTGESVSRGKHYFEETIKRAPDYAPAYTGLVAVYNVMAMNGDVAPREALPKMRAAALRALELDEALKAATAIADALDKAHRRGVVPGT